MSKHVVTLLPGDGIGPEVVGVAVRAIEALDLGITWERGEIGEKAIAAHGTSLPEDVLESVRASHQASASR